MQEEDLMQLVDDSLGMAALWPGKGLFRQGKKDMKDLK